MPWCDTEIVGSSLNGDTRDISVQVTHILLKDNEKVCTAIATQ